MPWSRTGQEPDHTLWRKAEEVAAFWNPLVFIIENVRGAQRWHGKATKKVGQRYFWGRFPPFDAEPDRKKKESYSSNQKAERSFIPRSISLAICLAMEQKLDEVQCDVT